LVITLVDPIFGFALFETLGHLLVLPPWDKVLGQSRPQIRHVLG
jgi:hypothetical protein